MCGAVDWGLDLFSDKEPDGWLPIALEHKPALDALRPQTGLPPELNAIVRLCRPSTTECCQGVQRGLMRRFTFTADPSPWSLELASDVYTNGDRVVKCAPDRHSYSGRVDFIARDERCRTLEPKYIRLASSTA